jgi:hypothetical protein
MTKIRPLTPGEVIFAIDPGGTTGICVGRYEARHAFTIFDAWCVPWSERFDIKTSLALHMPDRVVVESFRLYAHAAQDQINSDFPSVRVIGMVEAFLSDLHWLDKLTFQPPSVRQNVEALAEHRNLVNKSAHTYDAYRHLRFFVLANRGSV